MASDRLENNRRKAQRRGRFAEYLAAIFLTCKGYRILALRYKTKLGEIDIVAKRGRIIAFIEVKARRDHGIAVDAVSYESQHRIRAASDLWLTRHANVQGNSLRYDIITISPRHWPKHLLDAF